MKHTIKDTSELKKKLNLLLTEAKIDEAQAKAPIEQMLYIGKQQGLLWAINFVIQLEELADESR